MPIWLKFMVSHLLSVIYSSSSARVLFDVVVEGAAGVGHEHVLEGRLGRPRRSAVCALSSVGRVLGDDPTVVEDRDPGAQALGLGQVVGRQDDRRVMGLC